MGNLAEEMAFGKLTFARATKRLFAAANDAFNPLGGGSLGQFISPTATDPFMQLSENKNFYGAPIMKKQLPYQSARPNSSMYFKGVRSYTKRLTGWLNRITGGTDTLSGTIDVNPEILDHLIDFMGGGLGRFLANSVNLGVSVLTKQDTPEINKLPMVRQFLKEPSPWTDTSTIHEMLDESRRNAFGERERARFADAIRRASESESISEEQRGKYEKQFRQNQADAQAEKRGERSRESILDRYKEYNVLPENEQDLIDQAISDYNDKASETGQKLITKKMLFNASRRGTLQQRKER